MYAVVDIGSSYLKMSVYKKIDNMSILFPFSLIASKTRNSKLLQHVEKGKLSLEGQKILFKELDDFFKEVNSFEVQSKNIFVVATEVLRASSNRNEIKNEIKKRYNWDLTFISGKEEALFVYEAVYRTLVSLKQGSILDLGGGSSEIIQFNRTKINFCESFPYGILRIKKLLNIISRPSHDELKKIMKFVEDTWNSQKAVITDDILIVVGGGAFNIGLIFNYFESIESKSVNGKVIKLKELENLLSKTEKLTSIELECIPNFDITRTSTIELTMAIFISFMKCIKADTLMISKYSLKEGLLLAKFT